MNPKFVSAAIFAAIFLSACNKDYNPGGVTPSNPSDPGYTMQSAMDEIKVAPKTTVIDAATGGSFYGSSGTRYTFPPNAFVTSAGTIVTGNVSIQTSEYINKSDMMFSGVLPVSGGEPLISGGEIEVQATQGGQVLQMAPNTTFRANMPVNTANAPGMGLFNGTRDPKTGNVAWRAVQIDSTGGSHTNRYIATIGSDTVSVISDSLTMCNADRFMSDPHFKSFKVTVIAEGDTLGGDSVKAFALFDEYNGVWPLGVIGSYSKNIFHEMHVPDIPVHFVVIATIKGKFYGGITAATPADSADYKVTLSKTTSTDFKKQVSSL